jgi:hypothetical protein
LWKSCLAEAHPIGESDISPNREGNQNPYSREGKEKLTKSELPPVKERLKNLNEQDLKILKYLVDHYQAGGQTGNPVFVRQITSEFRDLAYQTIVGMLRRLENRKLIESGEKAGEAGFIYEGKRKIKLYWIINKETYRKLERFCLEEAGEETK